VRTRQWVQSLLAGDVANYNPETRGRHFYSEVKPNLPASKVARSFEEAVALGSHRVQDPQGNIKYLEVVGVPGVNNTYRLKYTPEEVIGHAQRAGTNSGVRRGKSIVSTADNTDMGIGAKKIARISDQGRQFHHIMDLDSYAPYFEGLSPEDKALQIAALNQHGFYPGDDRRNYIGLVGSQTMGNTGRVVYMDNNEHQSDIHPRLIKLRKAYPINTVEEISTMNPTQRVEAMLPHLLRDRAELHKVLDRRRPGLSDRVSVSKRDVLDKIQEIPQRQMQQERMAGDMFKDMSAEDMSAFGQIIGQKPIVVNADEGANVYVHTNGNGNGKSHAEIQRGFNERR
jgi:hypothetical protein